MDWSIRDLAFVDLDPTTTIPLKVADVVRQHRDTFGHATSNDSPTSTAAVVVPRRPPPDLPPELLTLGGAASSTSSTASPTDATGVDGSAVGFAAAHDWVDVEESGSLKSSQTDAAGEAALRQLAKTASQLAGVRIRVVADLQTAASSRLTPRAWVNDTIPRVKNYLGVLDFLAERQWRTIAYFFWHPGESAVNDVHYDAAGICASAAACEARAAASVARRAARAFQQNDKDNAEAAADEKMAYRLFCSAAEWYRQAAQHMAEYVEPELAKSRPVQHCENGQDEKPASPLVHPALSSALYRSLQHTCLAAAQEIGFHRALQPHAAAARLESLSPSQTLACDRLTAGLASQASTLYQKAVDEVKKVPAPSGGASRAAAAKVFAALESYAASKANIWAATAHALVSRAHLKTDSARSVAHAVNAQTLAKRADSVARSPRTAEVKISTTPLADVFAAVTKQVAFVSAIADAVHRINNVVMHEQPDSAALAAAACAWRCT